MALLGLIFTTNVYRAATQSITHDEGVTYENFVAAPWSIVFNSYDANHHVLHTIFCKIFVDLLGVSPLTLRLASVLSGLLYLYLVFRICERLFGTGWYLPLSALLLSLNPYLLDFESAARGYGMAVAFLFLALWEMLEWLDKPESGRLIRAGLALGLSIGANLVLAPPAIGLALMFLLAVWNQRRSFKPTVTVTKKGTKKETPNPFPTLGQALVRFALPLVGIAALIVLSPLSNSSGQQFYIGAASLRAGAESIVHNSLQPAPGWLISALALAVLPAVIIAAALIAWRAASRWIASTLLERTILLTGGAMLIALAGVLASHLLFDVPYPESRTAIYWIPLLTLTGLALAYLWERATVILALPMAACIAMYIAQFRVTYYADWPYDRDDRAIANLIREHKPAADRKAVVEGSWQLEPSINFYRVSDHLDWMQEVERATPKPGADFYLLLAQDSHFVNDLHLKILFQGNQSGTILAQP
ncbi:MAG TPA: glycosyltransferase family 39 protein [Bryobacteraceae bacterium]|nr:glycosyltransferase family 39 protein [Bryobacteraceae bacterium]